MRDKAFLCYQNDFVTIQDLDFEQYSEVTIYINDGHNVTVKDCSFSNCYEGINDLSELLTGPFFYHDNSFTHMYNDGIRTAGGNSEIYNNTFTHIGETAGLGSGHEYPGYMALASLGTNVDIHDNVFEDIGYVALWLKGAGTEGSEIAHRVHHNSIRNAQTVLNDGGGIFFDECDHLVIEDNVIRDIGGNFFTTAEFAGGNIHVEAHTKKSAGIYIHDLPTQDVTIRRNTVSGCVVGLNLDHTKLSRDLKVIDNILFNNTIQMNILDYSNYKYFVTGGGGDGNQSKHASAENTFSAYGDEYTGNIMYCMNEDQKCMVLAMHWWVAEDSDFDENAPRFGTFSGNKYFNPFSPTPIAFRTDHRSLPYTVVIPRTLLQWQGFSSEGVATGSPLSLNSYVLDELGDPPILSADFNSGFAPWPNPDGCLSNPPFTIGDAGMGGNVLQNGTDLPCGLIYGAPEFGNEVEGPYRLRFSIKASTPTVVVASVNFNYPDFPGKAIIAGPVSQQVDLFFEANVPTEEVYVVLPYFMNTDLHGQLGGTYATITLDNVELQECSYGEPVPAANDHILRYYDPRFPTTLENAGASFNLPFTNTCWSDVYGNFYGSGAPISLNEYESRVFFKFGGLPPAPLTFTSGVYTVQGTTTWTNDWNIEGRVIVPDDATLIVDGATIGFATSTPELTTNITVEPGGTLQLINGAILTNWQGCGEAREVWDGIIVQGTTADAQQLASQDGPQGRVIMRNGSTIANAMTGILVGDATDLTMGGGIVSLVGTLADPPATFRNCQTGIEFKPYRRAIDFNTNPNLLAVQKSYLDHVKFEYNDLAPMASTGLRAHVVLDKVVGLVLAGCQFKNTTQNVTESAKLGHGILSMDARYSVKPACPVGLSCVSAALVRSTFDGLDHGIHALGAYHVASFSVDQTDFSSNICGVFSSAPGFAVTGNTFDIGGRSGVSLTGFPDNQFQDMHRGIYTNNAFGFSIWNNSLAKTAGSSIGTEGIVIGYSRDHNDVVYLNTATDLDFGFVGEGICANGGPNMSDRQGLQLKCNSNNTNGINLWSRNANGADENELLYHTIRTIQGSGQKAANNHFDQYGLGAEELDYRVDNTARPIRYYYRNQGDQVPTNYTVGSLLLSQLSGSGDCEPHPWVGPIGPFTRAAFREAMVTHHDTYASTSYLYGQLIDGGNTETVVQEITESWPSQTWELRTYLLGESPYLSVEALKEMVAIEWLPDAVKGEVCIANPDATSKDGFLKWAEEEAPYPLPEYILGAIVASWDQETFRTDLETLMADQNANMFGAANELWNLYREDSTGVDLDSLRYVATQLHSPSGHYAEALTFMEAQDFDQAAIAVFAMEDDQKLSDEQLAEQALMITFIDEVKILDGDGRSVGEMNSGEIQNWETLIADHYDRPGTWMSNILCFYYGICRAPHTGGTGGAPKSRQFRTEEPVAEKQDRFLLFPNPAQNYSALSFELSESTTNGQVTVTDATGRTMATQKLSGQQGQVLFDTRGWGAGLYTIACIVDGTVVQTEKLMVP